MECTHLTVRVFKPWACTFRPLLLPKDNVIKANGISCYSELFVWLWAGNSRMFFYRPAIGVPSGKRNMTKTQFEIRKMFLLIQFHMKVIIYVGSWAGWWYKNFICLYDAAWEYSSQCAVVQCQSTSPPGRVSNISLPKALFEDTEFLSWWGYGLVSWTLPPPPKTNVTKKKSTTIWRRIQKIPSFLQPWRRGCPSLRCEHESC